MLDVTYDGLLEAMPWEAERSWRDLLKVLRLDASFAEPSGPSAPAPCRSTSCSIPRNQGAIVSAVSRGS